MDPKSDTHLQRLKKAVEYSRTRLAVFRKNRLEAIRQFVGEHYSEDGAKDHVPINLLEMAVNIFLTNLVAKAPQVLVSTPHLQLKSMAADYELAMNYHIRKIKLVNTLQEATVDAMFSMGIVKSGLELLSFADQSDVLHEIGRPFSDSVDLDNWVHDTAATHWSRVSFAGDRYRVPLELAKASESYRKATREKLVATRKGDSEENGEERAEGITKGATSDPDEYEDYVELWDLWLPRDNLVLTIPAEGEPKVLRLVEWEGPRDGPYQTLSFETVPGNIMPLPPVALWRDLHELSNRIFNKIARQADRQKTVLGVRAGKEDDGKRVVDASDGEAISMDNPENAREFRFGGVDGPMMAFQLQLENLYNKHAGNLDVIGGLSPQAETLGQEELLTQASNKRIQAMQSRVHDFAVEVIKSQGWYLWHDPLISLPLSKRVPGTSIEVPVSFSPEERNGEFEDYNIDIQVYSMAERTPAQMLQMLQQIFTQFLVPFAPQLEAQGKMVDIGAVLQLVGKYANFPDLNEILVDVNPQQLPGRGPVGDPSEKFRRPPMTQRTNVRVNRSTANREGQNGTMAALLMGGGAQPKSIAQLGAPRQ
ncbi:MAG: hypothetical protein ABIL09_07920 [Gemmatimonadota bacterium]